MKIVEIVLWVLLFLSIGASILSLVMLLILNLKDLRKTNERQNEKLVNKVK